MGYMTFYVNCEIALDFAYQIWDLGTLIPREIIFLAMCHTLTTDPPQQYCNTLALILRRS